MRPCRQPAAGRGDVARRERSFALATRRSARRGGATDRHGVPIGALHHLAHGRTVAAAIATPASASSGLRALVVGMWRKHAYALTGHSERRIRMTRR